jgi:hypothetical protein
MKTSGKSWAKYIDKSIKAKKSGWRTSSETGERYYEDRPNHSDVSRKDKYAKGGLVQGDVFKVTQPNHTATNEKYTFVRMDGDVIIAKKYPNLKGESRMVQVVDIDENGVEKVSKEELNKGAKFRVERNIMLRKAGEDYYAKGGEVKLDADFYEKLQKAEMNWTKDNGKEYNRLMAIKNKAEEGKYSNKKMAKGGGVLSKYTITFKNSKGEKEYHSTEANSKSEALKVGKFLEKQNNQFSKGGFKAVSVEEKMAKGGKTKKAKEPMIVRSYFEDEAIDYGKGGAISVGDKVKITSSNKTMVVKNISKGKKGYVEFSGSEGTYLIGDLEKFELGGMTSGYCYSIGGL